MGESNGAWGELARRDDELAEVFDRCDTLPEGGINPALDAFVERKRITIGALVRLGARISDQTVLAVAFPGGIKYRDMVTDRRWSYVGSSWHDLKVVYAGAQRAAVVIVAEGETDAARLTLLYPDADVAVLPAGADPRPHTQAYAAVLSRYELVLLAQDHGRAGDDGAAMLQEHLVVPTLRWLAPIEPVDNTGWGDLPLDAAVPPLPDPAPERLWLAAGELLVLEPPDIISHLEQAILPVTGQMILHGPLKSFKSMVAFDLAAALAQGQPWCGFEATDEPLKVMVLQYEIPWAYYQQRLRLMRARALEPACFDENLLTWSPLARPRFVAGNLAAEDGLLRGLEDAGAQVFILDPIRRGVGAADLNSEKEVRPMLHFLQRVQDQGITVIATHHDNKAGARAGGGSVLDMTGSGAFGGDADSIVSIALPRGQELASPERNLRFLLRNAPSPSPRSLRMTDAGIEYSDGPVGEDETPDSEHPPI